MNEVKTNLEFCSAPLCFKNNVTITVPGNHNANSLQPASENCLALVKCQRKTSQFKVIRFLCCKPHNSTNYKTREWLLLLVVWHMPNTRNSMSYENILAFQTLQEALLTDTHTHQKEFLKETSPQSGCTTITQFLGLCKHCQNHNESTRLDQFRQPCDGMPLRRLGSNPQPPSWQFSEKVKAWNVEKLLRAWANGE